MRSSKHRIHIPVGGLLPLLGLFTVLQIGGVVFAAEQTKDQSNGLPCVIEPGQNAAHAELDAMRKSRLVTGEVMKLDGGKVVVKDKNGKDVGFQLTENTEKPPLQQGDHISVSVDDQNRALWIRGSRSTDRRSEHVSADCNPMEDVSSETLNQFGKTSGK